MASITEDDIVIKEEPPADYMLDEPVQLSKMDPDLNLGLDQSHVQNQDSESIHIEYHAVTEDLPLQLSEDEADGDPESDPIGQDSEMNPEDEENVPRAPEDPLSDPLLVQEDPSDADDDDGKLKLQPIVRLEHIFKHPQISGSEVDPPSPQATSPTAVTYKTAPTKPKPKKKSKKAPLPPPKPKKPPKIPEKPIFKRRHVFGRCAVPGCFNNQHKTSKWSGEKPVFYNFPRAKFPAQNKVWLEAIGRTNEDGTPWIPKPGQRYRICSDHFPLGHMSGHHRAINYGPTWFPDVPEYMQQFAKYTDGVRPHEVRVVRVLHHFEAHDDTGSPDHMSCLLQEIWKDELTKDVSIVCRSGEVVCCHAAVLCLASDFVSSLMKNHESGGQFWLHLPDVDVDWVQTFLEILYCVRNADIDLENESRFKALLKLLGVNAAPLFGEKRSAMRTRKKSQKNRGGVTFVRDKGAFVEPVPEPPKPAFVRRNQVKQIDCTLDRTEFNVINYEPKVTFTGKVTDHLQLDFAVDDDESDPEKDQPPAGKMTVSCILCGKSFETTLASHAKLMSQVQMANADAKFVIYKCQGCKHLPVSKDQIADHRRKRPVYRHDEEPAPKSLLCPDCGKCFTRSSTLEYHLNQHKGLTPFACQDCDFKSHSKRFLSTHRVRAHPEKDPRPVCSLCPEPLTFEHELRHHAPDLEFSCDYCAYKAAKQRMIETHTATHHPKIKPSLDDDPNQSSSLLCPECGDIFKSKTHLEFHLNEHQGLQPFRCNHCDFKTHSRFQLSGHKRTHQRFQRCTLCPEKMTPDHMEQHHREEVEFGCAKCPYRASAIKVLEKHKKTYHKDKTMIQCPECPAMILAKRLKRHHVLHHNTSLAFGCDQCGYRGLTEGSIKVHMGAYHSVKKYPCELGCGAQFTQSCTMRYHTRRACPNRNPEYIKEQRERYREIDRKKSETNRANRQKKVRLYYEQCGIMPPTYIG